MAGLPDDIGGTSVLDSLATGVEGQQRGGLSLQRLGEWAGLSTFRQVCVVWGSVGRRGRRGGDLACLAGLYKGASFSTEQL
jgi:hypothetical protein